MFWLIPNLVSSEVNDMSQTRYISQKEQPARIKDLMYFSRFGEVWETRSF